MPPSRSEGLHIVLMKYAPSSACNEDVTAQLFGNRNSVYYKNTVRKSIIILLYYYELEVNSFPPDDPGAAARTTPSGRHAHAEYPSRARYIPTVRTHTHPSCRSFRRAIAPKSPGVVRPFATPSARHRVSTYNLIATRSRRRTHAEVFPHGSETRPSVRAMYESTTIPRGTGSCSRSPPPFRGNAGARRFPVVF